MSIRRFKQQALAKVLAGIWARKIDIWLNTATPDEEMMLAEDKIAGAERDMPQNHWLVDVFNEAAGIQNAVRDMFKVYRKKDKEFVGEFETEAEALAAIAKAKSQKKAALYLA